MELLVGAMDSDGFRELRNGVRDFVCVISVRGLSSLDAWLRGSVGIFATSLGFTRCFRKPPPFHSLEAISQLGGYFAAISKPEGHFAAISKP